MINCGLYEILNCYVMDIGILIKFSISGIVLGLVFDKGVIVCYSFFFD